MTEYQKEIIDNLDPKERGQRAKDLFFQGYNCSQSIVKAYEDFFHGMDIDTVIRMMSGFGGGMGRLREVCGAVTGTFALMGMVSGYNIPSDEMLDSLGIAKEDKVKYVQSNQANHYANIQELAKRFEEENGSIICRELLGLDVKRQEPIPEARTKEYYEKRPCPDKIYSAAKILGEYLRELE